MTDGMEVTEYEKDCLHESGHAVIAVLCGLTFKEAYAKDGRGYVDITFPDYQKGILSAKCADKCLTSPYIYAWYAGELAVELKYGVEHYKSSEEMSSVECFAMKTKGVNGTTRNAFMDVCRDYAKKLVTEHLEIIQFVAERLEKNSGLLTREQVEDFVTKLLR